MPLLHSRLCRARWQGPGTASPWRRRSGSSTRHPSACRRRTRRPGSRRAGPPNTATRSGAAPPPSPDAALILVIVVLNATLGFVQEYRAERSLQALKALAAPKAHVLREGETIVVPARDPVPRGVVLLAAGGRRPPAGGRVPGDVVRLAAGDRVPADGRLVETAGMRVNEASLTGESLPVTKTTDVLHDDAFLADRKNMTYMGTTVEGGRGKAVIAATGMATELGKIATPVQQEPKEETPIQRRPPPPRSGYVSPAGSSGWSSGTPSSGSSPPSRRSGPRRSSARTRRGP